MKILKYMERAFFNSWLELGLELGLGLELELLNH